METIELSWGVIIAATVAWIVIMYLVISAGVSKANKKQLLLLQFQNRMLYKMLLKQGYTEEELKDVHKDVEENYYWHTMDLDGKKQERIDQRQ